MRHARGSARWRLNEARFRADCNLLFRWFVGLPMDAKREHQLEITRLIQNAGDGFRRRPVVVVLDVGAARPVVDAASAHRAVGRRSLGPQGSDDAMSDF